MSYRLLYYSKSNLQDLEYILRRAAKYNFKLMIATKPASFFAKCKFTKVIAYNNLELKQIKRVASLIYMPNLIFTPIEELEHTLKNYNLKRKYYADLKADIGAFLDYINLQPVTPSNIVIKHSLFVMVEKNINKCSFSILKQVCNFLHLDWEQEKTALRNNLKMWTLSEDFHNYEIEDYNFNILNTITEIYNMYISNPHKHINKNNYIIEKHILEVAHNIGKV